MPCYVARMRALRRLLEEVVNLANGKASSGAVVTNVTNTVTNTLAQAPGQQASPAGADSIPSSFDKPIQLPWRRRRKRSAGVTNTKKVPLTGAQRQDRYRKKDPDRFDRLREEAKEHMAALRKRRKAEKETA
jgi:hypothetical protein